MAKLEDHVQLVALALLNLADDQGYFLADPRLVRSFARPFDDDSSKTTGALQELSRVGYIEIHESTAHGAIGKIVHFSDHQVISHPKPSRFKDYYSTTIPVKLHEASILKGREGKGMEQGKEGNGDLSLIVYELLKIYPTTKHRTKPIYIEELKACEAITRDGAEVVLAGTKAYAAAVEIWPEAQKKFTKSFAKFMETQEYLVDPATWSREEEKSNYEHNMAILRKLEREEEIAAGERPDEGGDSSLSRGKAGTG